MGRHDSFGEWLRRCGRELDLTRAGLGQCARYSASAICKIETEKRRPSRQTAMLLAQCLRIPPAERPTPVKVASLERGLPIACAQEVARQYGIFLAIPLFTFPDHLAAELVRVVEHKLLVNDPDGAIVIEHVKYGGALTEGYRVQGDGKLQAVDTPFGVLSGVICYDLDYPAVIQQAGQNGTGLMLVPSKDWYEIDPIHSHMAVFRAIENGMSLVRQTDAGLSLAVDPCGRVLAQTDFSGATDRTMVDQVPVRHVPTLYTASGRWSERVCLVGFLLVVAWALIARRQME